jgi:HD-like signal output (HDOD) protein
MAKKETIAIIQEKIENLPLVDEAVWNVVALLDDPDSTFDQIVEKLSPDIATTFLKIANSAFYGREVGSLNYAVKVLGYQKMKEILISSTLMNHFNQRLDDFSFEKFQNQAQFCGAVSMILGKIMDYAKLEDLYTVALLHNIGKLVIAVYFKDEHRQIISLKKTEDLSTSEAEERILGVTHAEIGALVLERFNIPREVCEAVRFHDAKGRPPCEEGNSQLARIVRDSARIVGNFSLPEEIEPMEIIDRLKGTIEKYQKKYRDQMRGEIHPEGNKEAFSAFLEHVSGKVYRDLKGLRERVPLKR